MSAQLVNVQARIAEIHAMIALPPTPAHPRADGSDFATALAEAQARESGSTATAQRAPGPAERAPDPAWAPASSANASVLAPGTPVARLRPGAAAAVSAPAATDGPARAGAANAASPTRASESPSGDAGNRILEAAEKYLGVPYKWGGTNPSSGLDCSGFTQRVFRDLGVDLPRVSYDQARAGTKVNSLADARPGDLIYWGGGAGRPNHIGIYAGNGKMIHSPRRGDVVKYDSIRTAPPDAIRRVM